MKTIATVIASVMLSLGILAAPAHADEGDPVDAPVIVGVIAECVPYSVLIDGLYDALDVEKSNVAQATETIERLVRKSNRQRATIAELRQQLRIARRN